MVGQILQITFVLVAMFLVLSRAGEFSQAAAAIGGVYNGAVKTLQGR